MQNPYAAERKKNSIMAPATKVPSSAVRIFWRLFKCVVMVREVGSVPNGVNYNKIDDKGSDKIFNHILYVLICCAGLGVG
jgi:hypothetical protein